MKYLSLACTAALIVSGCTTTLETRHLDNDAATATTSDYTYYLPRQKINVTISYLLQSCSGDVNIRKTASISTVNEPDPSARFALLPDALSSGNKTTELTLETFGDGTIKSLGAKIDDRTAETASKLIESGSRIASIVLTGLAQETSCQDSIKMLVERRNSLISDLTDPLKYTGGHERAAARDALARLNAQLSITRRFSFTPNPTRPNEAARVSMLHEDSGLIGLFERRWLQGVSPTDTDKTRQLLKRLQKTALCIRAGDDIGTALINQPDFCRTAVQVTRDSAASADGEYLAYRDPMLALIVLCSPSCKTSDGSVLTAVQQQIAQFGPWRRLALKSSAFQDRSLSVAFSQGGQRTSVTRGTSADLEAIAGGLSAATTQAEALIGTIRSSELDEINAETALIKAKADRIEQQNRLNALQATD